MYHLLALVYNNYFSVMMYSLDPCSIVTVIESTLEERGVQISSWDIDRSTILCLEDYYVLVDRLRYVQVKSISYQLSNQVPMPLNANHHSKLISKDNFTNKLTNIIPLIIQIHYSESVVYVIRRCF